MTVYSPLPQRPWRFTDWLRRWQGIIMILIITALHFCAYAMRREGVRDGYEYGYTAGRVDELGLRLGLQAEADRRDTYAKWKASWDD